MAKKIAKHKPEKKAIAQKAKKRAVAKASDYRHVPLNLADEKEKAAEIVQQVEQEITGTVTENEPAMPAGNLITLEPLPKKGQDIATSEERAYREMMQAEKRAGKIGKPEEKRWEPPAAVAKAEELKPDPRFAEGDGRRGIRKDVLAKSIAFGLAGAVITSLMLGLVRLDAWMIGFAFMVVFLLTTAVSYLYLNYTSR